MTYRTSFLAIVALILFASLALAQPAAVSGKLTASSADGKTAGSAVTMDVTGFGAAAVQLSGTFVGTVTWEGTVDGTNWVGIPAVPATTVAALRVLTSTAAGVWQFNTSGYAKIRARCSAYTSGTVVVVMRKAGQVPPMGTTT
jgi:hypothetical protein